MEAAAIKKHLEKKSQRLLEFDTETNQMGST